MDDETIRALHQVDTHDLPPDHLRGTGGEFGKFLCYLAVRRLPPSRRVGPPIAALRSPVYRRDCLASDDERADIPRGPLDEFLKVIDPVEGEHLFPILKDGARHIAVLDQGGEPPPAPHDGLEDRGIADLLDRLHRRVLGEGEAGPRSWDPSLHQRKGAEKLVSAGPRRPEVVDHSVSQVLECGRRVQVPEVAHASLKDDVVIQLTSRAQFEGKVLGIEESVGDAFLLRGVRDGLLFPAYRVVKNRKGGRRLLSPIFLF